MNCFSSSLQIKKLILISSFCIQFCPPTISIMPGTTNAKPKQAMPGVSTSMEKMWQMEMVMMGQKQEVTLRINPEKILSTKMLLIIRFKPSMIDTQNTLTKFQRVNRPNTPLFGLNENSFPPKKQPIITKLMQRQRLFKNRFEKRGDFGAWQLLSKKRMARLPKIENRSPQNLLKGEQPRQKAKGLLQTGRLQESHMIMSAPITTRKVPAISLWQQSSPLKNLRMVMKKNFNLKNEKLWDLAVNFSANVPNSTHTEQFKEEMQCFCKFQRLKR